MKEIRKYYLEIDEETIIYVCVSSYIKGINPLDSSWARIKILLNNFIFEYVLKIETAALVMRIIGAAVFVLRLYLC